MVTDCRNGHIITCLFILLTSNEDQKIIYINKSESIHINCLEEEPKIQEIRLQLDGKHKVNCKKP